ncbi:MAG: ABC transporter permease [Bilifractor sp.]|jgi:ribose transport system permease protein
MSNEKETTKKKRDLSSVGILLALVVVIVLMAVLTGGKFLTFENIMNVFRQTPMTALFGIGELCVILLGGIDLSVGATLAFATCIAGVAYKGGVMNSAVLILICLASGAVLGAINGILLTKLHLPHPFIATLGTKNIYRGMALLITGATAVPFAAGTANGVKFLGSVSIANQFPVSMIFVVIVLIIMHIFLSKTGFGRKIYAFGGNSEAARLAGINVDRVQVVCYALSGFFASCAGIVYMGRLNSAVPLAYLEGDSDAIASCIIGGASFLGGKGNVWGTFVGAFMIATIRNGCDLMGISSDLQQIVIGAIIIGAVTVDVFRTRADAKAKRLAVAKANQEAK